MENALIVDFSKPIAVCDVKVGMYCELNEYMEICMYQMSRSFFDLCTRSLRMKLGLRCAIQDHWSSGCILGLHVHVLGFITNNKLFG